MQDPVIRRRENVPSLRRRDGLLRYAANVTSQHGEDGILQHIFACVQQQQQHEEACSRYLVDVGAWDGKHWSNTYSLLTTNNNNWKGILIEADWQRFQQLEQLHQPRGNLCLCRSVSGMEPNNNSLESILNETGPSFGLPYNFDFLCIDIDGADYWVFRHLLEHKTWRPQVVCIEFNPTMPNDLIYIPPPDDSIRQGASLAALVELGQEHDYVLAETTLYNAFLVDKWLFDKHLSSQVPDTSIEALHEPTMGTSLYQLYDGTIKLWGCKKLLWHRRPIVEEQLQMIPNHERHFPLAPAPNDNFDVTLAVDMTAFCKSSAATNQEQRQQCSDRLLNALAHDGLCYICGTGLSANLGRTALRMSHALLHESDEPTRRSCLATDRARRGYSPSCTENFASLLGEAGPNDLVRKFRVGPSQDTKNSLLQPNVWPDESTWEPAENFRSVIEEYYENICGVADAVLKAICHGLIERHPELGLSLSPLLERKSINSTSILTLLGYQVGSRHKGKNKGPLVAAHTDVSVITILLFDAGTCAVLQRADGTEWVDVMLPVDVSDDPIFVVNMADCLSDLCGGRLPSTLHRVVAQRQKPPLTPRNCCALFVGLHPDELLCIGGESMTYEEWRKRRIESAQNVLKESNLRAK